MKKFTTIITGILITTAVLATTLSGCDKQSGSGNSSTEQSTESTVESTQSTQSTESTSITEFVPTGEPTFLTCPDGTPIYTSQISKYQDSARNADGSHEQFPIETFNMETFTDNTTPQVVCEGFAYGFIPRYCVNITEAPEKFTNSDGIDMYSGEELPPSNEYFKIKTGDKFGSLTVKSAQSIFSNSVAYFLPVEEQDISGVYLTGAVIEYEGEVEMTGCIQVMKTEGYNTEGDLWFYPDGGFVSKIPAVLYRYFSDLEPKGIYHAAEGGSPSYGELCVITLGNMYDYDIDFDGLEPGDRLMRVKIIVKNPVVSSSDGYMDCCGEPAAVEVVK